jgi:hypothetical protein
MPDRLPNWVYDLINELEDQTSHPTLLFESGAFEGTAQYEWCPCNALNRVPAEVKDRARVIAAYRAETAKDKESTT